MHGLQRREICLGALALSENEASNLQGQYQSPTVLFLKTVFFFLSNMPFTKNGFSDTTLSSPLRAPTTEISFYSPVREPFKWSHKKFNRHQQRATCSAPCQQVPRPLRAAAEPVKTQGPSLTLRPHEGSPGKEEKKKKRRESDAKWRSNLSCCFNHLKNKVLPTRSCQKTRVSKVVFNL